MKNKHKPYRIRKKITVTDVFFVMCIVGFVMGMISTYFYKFHFSLSDSHQRWGEFGSYLGAISGSVAAIAVFFNLKQTKEELKKSNAMPILVDLMSELRQEKFIAIKRVIFDNIETLLAQDPIPISHLPSDLSKAITRYCYAMDNLGLMIKNRLIDQNIIISFYGIEMRYLFYIIEPFLKKEREFLIAEAPDPVNREAYRFYLFHYEFLVRLAETNSTCLIKEFDKLDKKIPNLQYRQSYDNIRKILINRREKLES